MFVAIHLSHHRSLHHLPHVCCHSSEPASQSSSPTACLLPFIWTSIAVFITYRMFVAIHLNHHRSLHYPPLVCCHTSEPSSQSSSSTACLLPSIWTIIAVSITYCMFVAIHLNHNPSLYHLPYVCCHPSEPSSQSSLPSYHIFFCHPSEISSQSSSPTTCLLPFILTIITVFITYHILLPFI